MDDTYETVKIYTKKCVTKEASRVIMQKGGMGSVKLTKKVTKHITEENA